MICRHSSRWSSARAAFGALGLLSLVSTAVGQIVPATFSGLGDLAGGENWSLARGISADGNTVVGESWDVNTIQPVRWTPAGGLQVLGALPGSAGGGGAYGVSGDGSVIVGQAVNAAAGGEAFRWTATGGMTGMGIPAGADATAANAVSADGSVVVGATAAGAVTSAFRWTSGTGIVRLEDPSGFDASGAAAAVSSDGAVIGGVAGAANAFFATQATLWTGGTGANLGTLASWGGNSAVLGLAADGAVAVGWSQSDNGLEAFRWTVENGISSLGTWPEGMSFSVANAVSADGDVVVGRVNTEAGPQAFMWTNGGGVVLLADFLTANGVNLGGWSLSEAVAISADGLVIAGNGTNPAGDPEGWVVNLRGPDEPPPPPPPPPPGDDTGNPGDGGGTPGSGCNNGHGKFWGWAKKQFHAKGWWPPKISAEKREALKRFFARAEEVRRRRRPVLRPAIRRSR